MSNLWLRFPSNVRRFIRVVLIDTKPKPKAALHEWSRHLPPVGVELPLSLSLSYYTFPLCSRSLPLYLLLSFLHHPVPYAPLILCASFPHHKAAVQVASFQVSTTPPSPPLSLSLPSPLCDPNCITYKIKQCQASKIDESPKSNRKGKRSEGWQVGGAGESGKRSRGGDNSG